MANKLILYNLDFSPPVRCVKAIAKLIGLELELRDIKLFEREHLKEPFISLNPEHTVPTLIDGDFVIWDSHAICAYLIDKYAKDDKLYPKDLQLRAKCNQRLFFDASSLFVRLRDCIILIMHGGASELPQDKIDPIYASFDILEAFLKVDPFLVGSHLTLADISLATTILPLETFAPITENKYPKILAWIKRVRNATPVFDEVNAVNLERSKQWILSTMEKNKQKA